MNRSRSTAALGWRARSAWRGRGNTILDACAVGVGIAFSAGGIRWSVVDLILPVIVVRVGLGRMVGRPVRLNRGFIAFTLAFLTVAALSLLVASVADGHVDNGLAASHLVRYGMVLALGLGVAGIASGTPLDDVFRAMRIWSMTASLFGVGVGLWVAGLPTFVTAWGSERAVGTFGDPNFFAAYLMVSLAILLAANGYRRIRTFPLQFVAISVGIIGTGSRSALAGFAIIVATQVFFAPSVRQRLVLLLGASAGLGLLAYSHHAWRRGDQVTPLLATLFMRAEATGTDPRMLLWENGLRLWRSRPVFGIGAGQAATTTQNIWDGGTGLGFRPHSVYIATLAETGLAGMIVVAAGICWLLIRIVRTMRIAPKIGAPLLIGLILIAQQMVTLDLQNMRYVWVFIGLTIGVATQLRMRESRSDGSASSRFRPPAGAADEQSGFPRLLRPVDQGCRLRDGQEGNPGGDMSYRERSSVVATVSSSCDC